MRILVVSGNPYLASTTRPLHAALEILTREEVKPHFLFTRPGPWQEELTALGYPVIVRNLAWPSARRAVSSTFEIGWLISHLVRHGIDFIHCNEHEHYPAIRHASRLTGKPVLVTLHYNLEGGFARWAFAAPYCPRILQFLSYAQWKLSESELPSCLPSDAVHVTGSGLSVSKLRASITGRDLRKELGIDNKTIVLGTVGAIRPRKRMEDFIKLIWHLRRRNLPVVGLIAGGGSSVDQPYKRMLDCLIEQLELRDTCRFVGFIYPCVDFYKSLDIYVHSANMEIFCMAICEAEAMGIPCLVYDIGGNRETVPDSRYLVPFGSLEELVRRCEVLIRDKELRRILGISAQQFVEQNLDAPIFAGKMKRLYSLMLQASPILF